MRKIYMNKETGEVFESFTDMLANFAEEYDGCDPYNLVPWQEYYDVIMEG